MTEPEKGIDHQVRITSLSAFKESISNGYEAGLAKLGTLDEPELVFAALQLLVTNNRFQDAVDLILCKETHHKWVGLAVYANVALKNIKAAKDQLTFSDKTCNPVWVSGQCRIFAAEAIFREVLDDSSDTGAVDSFTQLDEEHSLLEFVIDSLYPLVEQVRLTGRVQGALQRMAVEFAAEAYGKLGQLSQITDLVKPLIACQPIPFVIANLTLQRLCDPPKGLPGRLRVEHPLNFSAKFLAAILDREIYDRKPSAFNHLINLRVEAKEKGEDAVEQLCRGIFETASEMGTESLEEARSVINELDGQPNQFDLYIDSVKLLYQENPSAALEKLESDKREDDPVWWQIAAQAYERLNDLDKATDCWDQTCQLMPHPDMLNHFAGMGIQQRRFKDAIQALKIAKEKSPEDSRILDKLAFAHTRLRQYAEAINLYLRLIQLRPEVPMYKVNLALCYVRIGDPDSALGSIGGVVNYQEPNMELISFRSEILVSLDRAAEAFSDLEQLRDAFWNDPQFLALYMDAAYRSSEDKKGQEAFQQIKELQDRGQLKQPFLYPVSLDDLKEQGIEHQRQRESLLDELSKGKMPWVVVDSLLSDVPDEAWFKRTQKLNWLPDDKLSRSEFTIYATNCLSVQKEPDDRKTVLRIGVPQPGINIVADISAIITLHRLGRLTLAANFFEKLILPASFGNIPVHDRKRLIPHQPSQMEELQTLQDLVQRKIISVVDRTEITDKDPQVDEYEEGSEFSLSDIHQLLESTQRITSEELRELLSVCHRPKQSTCEIDQDSRVIFSTYTFRTLVRYKWIEQVLAKVDWCVVRDDYETEMRSIQDYKFRSGVYDAHQDMWREIKKLRDDGKIEYRDSPSCRGEQNEDYNVDGFQPFSYIDAALLAIDLDIQLLADDRCCQAVVLNQYLERTDAAFGTDRLLSALEANGKLSKDEVCQDFLQLIRWRYRFLILDPQHLKTFAMRSKENLPGPELREIAAYVQDSMRDPGLFCGPENADIPTPIAFSYFMAWKRVCVDFLATVWGDETFKQEELELLTIWCIKSLLPAVPRGLLYSPLGMRLTASTPKAFLIFAMIRFLTVQPLNRANEALRLMAKLLGMTDDEFFEAAAEAADGILE